MKSTRAELQTVQLTTLSAIAANQAIQSNNEFLAAGLIMYVLFNVIKVQNKPK